jgi:hypothetical protein
MGQGLENAISLSLAGRGSLIATKHGRCENRELMNLNVEIATQRMLGN